MGLSKGIRALLTTKNRIGLNRDIRVLLTIRSKIGLGGDMAQAVIKKASITIFK